MSESVSNPGGNATRHAPEGAGRQQWAEPVYARANATGDTRAEQSHSYIKHANDLARDYFNGIHADGHQYSEAVQRERVKAFQSSQAFQGIPAQVQAMDDEVARLQARCDAEKRAQAAPFDAAGQEVVTRFWHADKDTLDRQDGVGKLNATAHQLADNAHTPEQKAALREQLPTYLANRGVPASAIEAVTAKIAPELTEAEAELAQAKRDQIKIRMNAQMVKTAIINGGAARTVVPL
jgi:hypothetical protein